MIEFKEAEHKYFQKDKEYISVTTLIGKYKNKFDTWKEATKYKVRHSDPRSVQEIVQAWDLVRIEACERGSEYHEIKEIENLYKNANLEKGYVEKIIKLSDLPDGLYPELRLYNDEYEIAGHADIVRIERPYIDVEDYKTNKDKYDKVTGALKDLGISKKSWGKNMLYPLQGLPDANFYHYTVQLNIYAWMLKQEGFIPRNLKLLHKKYMENEVVHPNDLIMQSEEDARKIKEYNLEYNDKLVETLLKHYKYGSVH